MSRHAYVTLATRSVPGALALAASYRAFQKRKDIPIVCMTTPDIPETDRQALQAVFDDIIPVNYVTCQGEPSSSAFTKWTALTLTQYDKVLFVDADMIFASNVDELFDLQAPAGTFESFQLFPYAGHGCVYSTCEKLVEAHRTKTFNETLGRENPYLGIKHGEHVSPKSISKAFQDCSSVVMGSLVLLHPSMNDFCKYMEFIQHIWDPGETVCLSTLEEQALTAYYVHEGILWTHIHQVFQHVPDHINWLMNCLYLSDGTPHKLGELEYPRMVHPRPDCAFMYRLCNYTL